MLDVDQRAEVIQTLTKFLESEETRVSALWALGKGNSRSCLDILMLWIDIVCSELDQIVFVQWLIAVETNLTPPDGYRYPRKFLTGLESLAQREDYEISNLAEQLLKKIV